MNPVSEITKLRRDLFTKIARWALHHPLDAPFEMDISAMVKEMIPDGPARYRCCIHKERAIVEERIKIAVGLTPVNHPVTVISEACNGCSLNKYVVTDACQNCVAHPCRNSCPKKAISVIQNRAFIDQVSCVECGKCAKACPYNAIIEINRPCERACAIGAIKVDDSRKAIIDNELCVSCGLCVTVCPFGAITDLSQMLDVIVSLRVKEQPHVAVIAPAIAGQFGPKVSPEQIKTALQQLGFDDVVEAALGADIVSKLEAQEIMEHAAQTNVMTNSCCPAFAQAVRKKLPELQDKISTTLSPMRVAGQLVKNKYDGKVTTVFIGPCIAKKAEANQGDEIDLVLTFEELSAILSAKEIDLAGLPPTAMTGVTPNGRLFARAGGVSTAVRKHLGDISLNVMQVQGLGQCLAALKTAAKQTNDSFTFIECMACEGGCVGGPGTMVTPAVGTRAVEKHAGEGIILPK
ncbi:monomeric [FeFe] hydrogenase [Desulforamulus hydrothermalis]|uniref:Hydrogenase large subunit domain protein n=1 Tax=Desulforamulus hydrothermalis Lam5 = DSM 18033 TaxID=1121428 RepID=K8EE90_9FIRM|nr:monomeric [FeFe] hydrogenase [Desulforamulus hydrothermalis]CCO07111.1 Hydrogenase large subunit domain protein [Desulforamulus hydrothermalis Lam5 = DSM 18033]SHG89921.1 [FeFe] hydrogenase, group B1/B3 [Desulforamulus hydrothermalis Lam5 = DSM 18033]